MWTTTYTIQISETALLAYVSLDKEKGREQADLNTVRETGL